MLHQEYGFCVCLHKPGFIEKKFSFYFKKEFNKLFKKIVNSNHFSVNNLCAASNKFYSFPQKYICVQRKKKVFNFHSLPFHISMCFACEQQPHDFIKGQPVAINFFLVFSSLSLTTFICIHPISEV